VQTIPWMYIVCGGYTLLCLLHVYRRTKVMRQNGGVHGPTLLKAVKLSLWAVVIYSIAGSVAEVTIPELQVPAHGIAVLSILPIIWYTSKGERE